MTNNLDIKPEDIDINLLTPEVQEIVDDIGLETLLYGGTKTSDGTTMRQAKKA